MKLVYKIGFSFWGAICMIIFSGFLLRGFVIRDMHDTVLEKSVTISQEIMTEISRHIGNRLDEFTTLSFTSKIKSAVLASDEAYSQKVNIQEEIDRIDQSWRNYDPQIDSVVNDILQQPLSKEFAQIIQFYAQKYDYLLISEIFLTNKYGAVIAMSGRTSDFRQNDESWWQASIKNGWYISDFDKDQSSDTFACTIGIAIRSDDMINNIDEDPADSQSSPEEDSVIGVLKLVLNLDDICNAMDRLAVSRFSSGVRPKMYHLLTQDGLIICSSEEYLFHDPLPYFQPDVKPENAFIQFNRTDPKVGNLFCIQLKPPDDQTMALRSYRLMMEYDEEEVLASIREVEQLILWMSTISAVILSALGLWIIFPMSKRLKHLSEVARKVGKGDLDCKIRSVKRDEIGEFSEVFDTMTAHLKSITISNHDCELLVLRRTEELQNLNAKLQEEIVERCRAEQSLIMTQNRINALLELSQMADQPMNEIIRQTLDRAVGLTASSMAYLIILNEREQIHLLETLPSISALDNVHEMEPFYLFFKQFLDHIIQHRTIVIINSSETDDHSDAILAGQPAIIERITHHMHVPVFNGSRLVAVAGVFNKEEPYNASDSQQLLLLIDGAWQIFNSRQIREEQTMLRSKLMSSHLDMERFAYAASHDLQEPLRRISNFTQLLYRRYLGKLNTEADEFIDFIVSDVKRMQDLLNDLMIFISIDRQSQQFEPVNLNKIIEKSSATLKLKLNSQHLRIITDPLPEIMGDRVQMIQLFNNLIDNAAKFNRSAVPELVIRAVRKEKEWIFSFTDNGIGIELEYQQSIFNLFQRLHPARDYSGTGVGLSICKKIVERHGGRIWMESQPQQGSTFYFSIPIMDFRPLQRERMSI